jgi:endoglucanase
MIKLNNFKTNSRLNLIFCLILLVVFVFSGQNNASNSDVNNTKQQHAQANSELAKPKGYLHTNDRVCFIGNSITHGGDFHHNIMLYYVTRFPDRYIDFYNCGISGDVTQGVLNRLGMDILVHKPTVAVIMLGMNDVRRSLYVAEMGTIPDVIQKREEALQVYQDNMNAIVDTLLSRHIRVILQTPTIYEQTAKLPAKNLVGVNDALKRCRDFIEAVGEEKDLPVVDYWTILQELNKGLQEKDSTKTIVGRDRVHPDATGHLVMAYQFLKTNNMNPFVSRMIAEKNVAKSNKLSTNCQFTFMSSTRNEMTFKVLEFALPFPHHKRQGEGLNLVPFTRELNIQLLQIPCLNTGNYLLSIDGDSIDVFSSENLNEGINLALYEHTPQFKQAVKVREALNELWSLESNLRRIKFVEYSSLYKNAPDKENLEKVVEQMLSSVDESSSSADYYKNQIKKYKENKPHEAVYLKDAEKIKRQAYEFAKPVEHTFTLTKLSN